MFLALAHISCKVVLPASKKPHFDQLKIGFSNSNFRQKTRTTFSKPRLKFGNQKLYKSNLENFIPVSQVFFNFHLSLRLSRYVGRKGNQLIQFDKSVIKSEERQTDRLRWNVTGKAARWEALLEMQLRCARCTVPRFSHAGWRMHKKRDGCDQPTTTDRLHCAWCGEWHGAIQTAFIPHCSDGWWTRSHINFTGGGALFSPQGQDVSGDGSQSNLLYA